MDDRRLSRRDWLKRTGLLALGVAAWPKGLPRVALAAPDAAAPGDVLVCIFMRGAADGLNLVVPYGDKDYYSHRDTLALQPPDANSPDAVVDLDGFFGLHPFLRSLKPVYDAGALAIVHAAGSPDPTHSHFDAQDFIERGTPGVKSIPTGWIGRHLQQVAPANAFPFRALGMGTILQASLHGPVPATALQSIADFHLQVDSKKAAAVQDALAALYGGDGLVESEGQLTLQALRDLAKIAQSSYVPANGASYPPTAYGKSLATVAQLIKAGVGLAVACVDIGGWDTHVQEGTTSAGQMPKVIDEFGKGLAAFYTDLQDQLKNITVVTMSEFGRRVQENTSHGTDHGHGNVMFVMGGGINGGKVYGEWPGLSNDKLYGPGDLAITTDFRDVLGEIVSKRLKNSNLADVFPGYPSFNFRGLAQDAGKTA
jgi:uncharacterized protein (DUF1501 family)